MADVAYAGKNFNIITDDTDVAVLLLHRCNEKMAGVTFNVERSKATFDIKFSLSEQFHRTKPYFLLVFGCDTSSVIH